MSDSTELDDLENAEAYKRELRECLDEYVKNEKLTSKDGNRLLKVKSPPPNIWYIYPIDALKIALFRLNYQWDIIITKENLVKAAFDIWNNYGNTLDSPL